MTNITSPASSSNPSSSSPASTFSTSVSSVHPHNGVRVIDTTQQTSAAMRTALEQLQPEISSRSLSSSTTETVSLDDATVSSPATASATVIVADTENALDELCACDHRPVVLALTSAGPISPDFEATMVLAGADAVIAASQVVNIAEMERMVTAVCNHQTIVSPHAARIIADLARDREGVLRGKSIDLTRRELDILQCVGRGENVRKTAATLGISSKTVENLQSRLFRKLNVKNRQAAFARANSLGLLKEEDVKKEAVITVE